MTTATKPDLRDTVRKVRFAAVLIVGPCLVVDAFVAWTSAVYFDSVDQIMLALIISAGAMVPFHGFRLWPEVAAVPVKPPPPIGIWVHQIPRLTGVPLGTLFALVAWSRVPALVALGVGAASAATVWPWWRRMNHIISGAIPTLIRN
jgi:hypothetical protein